MVEHLLIIHITVVFIGFACCFIATVLPYWFANVASNGSHLLRVGLWEVCFDEFATPTEQQKLFSGCFYIFDTKLKPLWGFLFNGWFITTQVLQVISLIAYILLLIFGVSMALRIKDRQQPGIVLTSVYILTFISWIVLTVLGVVGVNGDLERRRLLDQGSSEWIAGLESITLSWSYGLAAFSLLFALIGLNIIVWCVFPRKEPGGRLLRDAWKWPAPDELPCCLLTRSYRRGLADPSTLSNRPRPMEPRSTLDSRLPPNQPIAKGPTSRISADPSEVSSVGVVTYDPRSADTVTQQDRTEYEEPLPPTRRVDPLAPRGGAEGQPSDPRINVEPRFTRLNSRLSSMRSASEGVQVAKSMRRSERRSARFNPQPQHIPASPRHVVSPFERTTNATYIINSKTRPDLQRHHRT